jgi:hypothetical protein
LRDKLIDAPYFRIFYHFSFISYGYLNKNVKKVARIYLPKKTVTLLNLHFSCWTYLCPRHAVPLHNMPRSATSQYATQRHVTIRHAVPRQNTPCSVTSQYAMQSHVTIRHAVPRHNRARCVPLGHVMFSSLFVTIC